jgi:hypothetical protein
MDIQNLTDEVRKDFSVDEVLEVRLTVPVYHDGSSDDLIILCKPNYSGKLSQYINSLKNKYKNLGINNIIVHSGSSAYNDLNTLLLLCTKHTTVKPIPTIVFNLDDFIDGLKREYPTHFYGESPSDIELQSVNFTDKVWDDHIAVYKYFDRDPRKELVIKKGDKVFIGYQPFESNDGKLYHNLYITKDSMNWYHMNQRVINFDTLEYLMRTFNIIKT